MEDIFLSVWFPLISILWVATWIAGTVVAAIVFRRKGGRAQRMALWGFSLMLAVTVITPFLSPLLSWLPGTNAMGGSSPDATYAAVSGFLRLVQVAAIACIVYAFWQLGKAKVAAQ